MTRLVDLLGDDGSIMTGPFGTKLKASEYGSDGVPVISVGEVGQGRFQLRRDTPLAPEVVVSRLPEFVLQEGDIVFARKGAVDRSARVGHSESGWFLGSDGLRLRPPKAINSRWLAYYFQLPSSRSWLLRHAAGTTMLSLSGTVLGELPVNVPHRKDQEAVAAVLGALDEKIAVNHVVASASEKLLMALADLALTSTTPGQVTDLVEFNPITPRPQATEAVYLDMKSLPTTGLLVDSWGHRPPLGGARFINGDTLLARITPCLENRKTGMVDFLDQDEVGVGSTEFIVMRAQPGVPLVLPYAIAVSSTFREFAIKRMVGTSGRQRVNASDLEAYRLMTPNSSKLCELDAQSTPIIKLLSSLRYENVTLSELRDTLLPALMSGRLRVKDAEKQVEEAI